MSSSDQHEFQSALRMRGLFNPRRSPDRRGPGRRFNPPCGCVAFSTISRISASPSLPLFQSALRMRGLFNSVALHNSM